MSHTIQVENELIISNDKPGILKRGLVLSYGVLAYCLGVAGLGWLILAVGGLAPVGISNIETSGVGAALLMNTFLIVVFGVQHSVMARKRFKNWLTALLPAAAERATYMLMSGVCISAVLYFWQDLPGTLWSVENTTAQIILWSLYAMGWAYLLVSTFVTNHFELMGLRQVYLYFINKPYTTLPFTRKLMYSYSRHPMMLGLLIGTWAIPTMSISHFVMAVLITLYMIVGLYFEERDLLKEFGDTYRKYKQEIATIVPGMY